MFIVALLLFVQTQHYILITTTAEIGAIIHKLRVRLMDYVRRSELLPLENIGRAQIVAAITMETSILTQAANTLAFAAQGALLILLVAAYVAYLSLIAFVLGVIIVGIGAALFHAKSTQLAVELREAAMWENRLFDRLSDVLDGFKEVRLNRAAQRRAVRARRRSLARRRQPQDQDAERNLPPDDLPADLALHAARRGGVRGADVLETRWAAAPSPRRSPRWFSSSAPASAWCSRSRSWPRRTLRRRRSRCWKPSSARR